MKRLYAVLTILFILLFIGGPGRYSDPVIRETWDTGHAALFALAVFALLRRPPFRRKKPWISFGIVTLLCLAAGLATEILQIPVGRDFDTGDLSNDLLGGWLGWTVAEGLDKSRRKSFRISMLPAALLILSIVLGPVCRAAFNAAMIRRQFPVLSDLETPFELDRWKGKLASPSLDGEKARHGRNALRIELEPGIYPGVFLETFHRDWRGYNTLRFSLYNTTARTVDINLKIYDRLHIEKGYEYIDRFNRTLTLAPGWNDIRVPLSDVRTAPRGRTMDLSRIESFSLFLSRLDRPMTMYFDCLRLSRE